MDAQMKRGLLEVCILSAIRDNESYGYKIISVLEPHIKISESTLYPILRRLESNGSVTTRTEEFNGRLRKYFRITTKGRAKIAEFVDDMIEFKKISDFITRNGEI
ncbi:MAG: PadR family transcriptional regulator [Ruminococcaceae bacterium]|nr:PadR family transcriptional regulator [Oscillospiraceae bacterium]